MAIDFEALLRAEIGGLPKNSCDIELGGETVTLYASTLTPGDMKLIARNHPNFAMSPTMEGMVDLLIMKCRDETDALAFTIKHKPFLMRVGTTKIGKLFGELFAEQMVTEDDEKFEARIKN